MTLVLLGVPPACASKDESGLSCSGQNQCVYSSEKSEEVCHLHCEPDAGAPCPSGQVCKVADACCGGIPHDRCKTEGVFVCCPAAGC